AEDGIRDKLVTGVQTCALPICQREDLMHPPSPLPTWSTLALRAIEGGEDMLTLTNDNAAGISPAANGGLVNSGAASDDALLDARSEERRVGKEGRRGGGLCPYK